MAFPGWAPPLLTDEQAAARYVAGERVAVIAGDPADPTAGIVLDKGNNRLAVRVSAPVFQLAYTGPRLALAEAFWTDEEGRECWARRDSAAALRVARRAAGAVVWVEELLAHAPDGDTETLEWPDFGEWSTLDVDAPTAWIAPGALTLIDADGWMLDALEADGVTAQWRELGRKYDAPRAFGLPPEVQVKLAEPLGWEAAGRRWRKSTELPAAGNRPAVTVVTDALFAAGAGASGEIVTTVTSGNIAVSVDLPSATARLEMRSGQRTGSHPRPSTGAQVAVTAILETGGAAHEAIVAAAQAGSLPKQWASVLG